METIEQDFIDESIRLELNMSDLYRLLSITFPEDEEFWATLSGEEIHHAALIRSVNELFLAERVVPRYLLSDFTQQIHQSNQIIAREIESIRQNTPSREEVFRLAFTLESSAGEIHYQRMVSGIANSMVEEIFQKLNGDDKFHARRILNYARQNNLAAWINEQEEVVD